MLRLRFEATRLSLLLIYVVVIVAALSLADWRLRNAVAAAPFAAPAETGFETPKPFFSLATNRTFGTGENPRLWLDYRGISSLDFRVYRVNDPAKFFAQLNDPHQMGQDEEQQIAINLSRSPSLLERVRAVKSWAYSGIRNYFRNQLKQDTRRSFNQKFRAADANKRTPLNVADYARVPLLNQNQLVTTWREPLAALENEYDRRMVPLGKREPGVYLVEAVNDELRAYTIVVVTDLAMVEKASPNGDLLVYAVDRQTGEPRADTHVEIVKERQTVAAGRTNTDGVFRTKLGRKAEDEPDPEIGPADPANNDKLVVLASQRDNFAISDLESFYFQGDGSDEQNVTGYIYTDRPIYRPTHQVFFKGILRGINEQGGYRALKSQTVTVTIKDPKEARVYEQELRLSSRGTFHGELTLAEEAPLGIYEIDAQTEEGSSTGSFEVAEYKKPEYKVTVTTPQKFVATGGHSKFEINARYFFGAPVANAEVKYYIYRSRYYPSYWQTDEPEEELDDEVDYSEYGDYYTDLIVDGAGKLDASGHLEVAFPVPPSEDDNVCDFQYRFEAQITDASRRSISGSASLVATRGNVIARATPDRYVYTAGQTANVKVTTTNYEGHPVAARVTLKFMARTYVKGEHKTSGYEPDTTLHETEIRSAEVTTNQEGEGSYQFPVSGAGSISIKTVVQQEGGKQYTSLGGFIWVASDASELSDDAVSNDEAGSIKLVPDKKSYRAGETAHVLAVLPAPGAHLLVTTELETVTTARHVSVPGRTTILDVPIEAHYAPNVFLSVTFVRGGDMYTGDQRLVVPARDKQLNLEIISNKQEYKPRDIASYTILARDADGAPVRDAEVSLGVVDEAIYSVSADYNSSIREQFYGLRYNAVETHLSISYSFTGFAGEQPVNLASTKRSYQLADFKSENEPVQPLVRKEFKDTAFWQPSAVTGSDGRATVSFRLPDNLTTWRATARGVTSDTKVGSSKAKVISRKDVILRLETPRFLTQGDTVTLSGIVHNYLKQAKSTQISIAVNGAQLVGPAQKTVTIDQQGEHRVDWQISAPQTGQITLLAKALTNTESDAVELTLDVVPRGLRETRVEKWMTSDDSAEQQFSMEIPANADLNSRRLRIEVAPSIAGTLFGALDYLTTYPYGCTEQTMSSFLPNIIVSGTLKEFKSTSIRNNNDLKTKVERGRARLYAFQHDDGGWGWWKDDQSDPFMTAYVIDGLTLAKNAGYQIDDERLARGREKLRAMLDSGGDKREIDPDTRAFMIYALTESGGLDNSYLDRLFAERQNLQPYGRALLALALSLQKMDQRAVEVANEIERSAQVTKTTAYWQTKRPARLDFTEEDQTEGTALSLKALVRLKPESSLLPLAARWLVAERPNGYYWNSTKDTAFAIFGLIDYVKVSRELTPSYDLEVYVNGETVVAEHVSDASSAQTFLVNRKGSTVGAANNIRIVKRGKGSLYFSGTVEFYGNDENVAARSTSELNITREYYRLQIKEVGYDLKKTIVPLSGEIHSGDLLVVKLRLTGQPARRLMIEDPIPSGAEQLETAGSLNLNYTDPGWSDWYSSREFRDRRTVFFIDNFDGDVTFQYAMRVQVPGEFVVAPARVERMYEPWTNANTTTRRFTFID